MAVAWCIIAQGDGSGLIGLLPGFALVGFLMYLMVIRPQQREQKQRAAQLENLKQNDRVITIGGIHGVVVKVEKEADAVTLKVDENTNTKIKVTLAAISRVVSGEAAKDSPAGSS